MVRITNKGMDQRIHPQNFKKTSFYCTRVKNTLILSFYKQFRFLNGKDYIFPHIIFLKNITISN